MSVFVIIVAVFGIATCLLLRSNISASAQPQVLAASTEVVGSEDMSILDKINKVRVEAGVPELLYSTAMKKLTADRVSDMSSNHYYNHISPDGNDFGDVIRDYDPESGSSCENLQLQIGDSWQTAVDAWVDSPAHYRCLTDPGLTRGAGSVTTYDAVSFDQSKSAEQLFVFAFIATN